MPAGGFIKAGRDEEVPASEIDRYVDIGRLC
jgi:hypothetical protein